MKRREFITLLGAAAAAWPLAARAQQGERVHRIGWLTAQREASLTPFLAALRTAFVELGYNFFKFLRNRNFFLFLCFYIFICHTILLLIV